VAGTAAKVKIASNAAISDLMSFIATSFHS
jgi:hypothetical protein